LNITGSVHDLDHLSSSVAQRSAKDNVPSACWAPDEMSAELDSAQSHAISPFPPSAVSRALINARTTILPEHLALLVSRLSYVGALSIRSSAMLAEAALEGARMGTITGLEMGRKTLEGLVTTVFDMLVKDSNNFGGTSRTAFGNLVEKYSNLGVLWHSRMC
jgi:hypothetical protein